VNFIHIDICIPEGDIKQSIWITDEEEKKKAGENEA